MTQPEDPSIARENVGSPPAKASRRGLLAVLAAGAGAVGLGLAAQRWMASRQPASPTVSAVETPPTEDWWSLSFETPDGSVLKLSDLRGKPLVLNFWATWCPPCVKELPDLERFWQAHQAKGWQVVGLAVDGPTPVRTYLAKQPLSFPIGLAGLDGSALARRLGNDKGGLPFTIVADASGRIAHRHLGASTYDDMVRWAAET